jgi:hypothetical protein
MPSPNDGLGKQSREDRERTRLIEREKNRTVDQDRENTDQTRRIEELKRKQGGGS